jgi:hypothetical protein
MFDDYVSGPIEVTASYSPGAAKAAQAVASLDFRDSTMSVPLLGWSKPPGAPASARLIIDLIDDKVTALRNVSLSGSGMDAALALGFGA